VTKKSNFQESSLQESESPISNLNFQLQMEAWKQPVAPRILTNLNDDMEQGKVRAWKQPQSIVKPGFQLNEWLFWDGFLVLDSARNLSQKN